MATIRPEISVKASDIDPNAAAMKGDLDGIREAQVLGANINYAAVPRPVKEVTEADENSSEKKEDDNDKDRGDSLVIPLNTGDTSLHIAAELGNLEVTKLLVDLMADVDKANRIGSTPLHRACSFGQIEEAKFLIERQASIHAQNKIGNTPLHCACYIGNVDLIALLVKFGANDDFGVRNKCGLTPYDYLPSKHRAAVLPYIPRSMLPSK